MKKWTANDIPSQIGKIAVVTGGSSGVGMEIARELTRRGAEVIIAADDEEKGQAAVIQIKETTPHAKIFSHILNLADFQSVENFSHFMKEKYASLDILINNAGITGLEKKMVTQSGHEFILTVNYLGHFALTGHLLPLLRVSNDSRIVFQSSLAHLEATLDFQDLDGEKFYDANKAYGQSKLAMLTCAMELARCIAFHELDMRSIPVHPGGARTHVFNKETKTDTVIGGLIKLLGHSAAQGALPALFAATSDEAYNGIYYGPNGFKELSGYPAEAKASFQAQNQILGERLWTISEEMTGVTYDFGEYFNLNDFELTSKGLPMPLWI
jgi:NAD(P)-dependent dehydrogenase (short-subunit alcohol dehydrogenase family)